MAGFMPFLLWTTLAAIILNEYSIVDATITMGEDEDFPMGMAYDEGYNIKKVKPKRIGRKTLFSYRLPKAVVPIHYNIVIKPILADPKGNETLYTSPGSVEISVMVVEATNSITVHSKGIDITHTSVRVWPTNKTATPVTVTGHNIDAERSFYTIFLDEDMTEKEEYNVFMEFVSKIPHKDELMAGFYRVNYMGSDGVMKTGAVTQFQKDDASRCFPCFDEPNMKAEYTFKIGRIEKGYNSFANMPRKGNPEPMENNPGWVWDTYERTLYYPVYTIAFAVMPDYINEDAPSGEYRLPVRTWVPAAERTNTSVKFAAKASAKILKYFEELFQSEFPLTKMENLAVPDMDLLAMEHPGLVTYRTNLLVWKKGLDTQFEIFNGASLIAHEFVHQWFGNLVTCKWWNDFWLNEAFARYYQFIGADESGIDFRAKDRYVLDVTQWAMEFDAGPESVPIRLPETDKVFYLPFHIEYEKGAAMIRMMQTILTEKTFITALRKYLKKFAWQNTEMNDLLETFTEQGRLDGTLPKQYTMTQIMTPWMTKTGFPIIQVSRGESERLYITQQRYLQHPVANDKIEPGLWYVPIWFVSKSNPKFDADNTPPHSWIDPDTLTQYILFNNTEDWIILNPQARGYYRVVYDYGLTQLIVKQLEENHTMFYAATRSQLFDDYLQSARSRYITIPHALMLTSYLEKEDDLIVWTTVFNNFRKVLVRIMDTPLVEKFKKFVTSKIVEPFNRIGPNLKENASPAEIMLYSMFLDWICTMEHELCKSITESYMKKWQENPDENPIPVDIQAVVYCSAVAHSEDGKIHEFLSKKYHSTRHTRQRNIIVRALTCDKNLKRLTSVVDNAINPDYKEINTTLHGALTLNSAARNPSGRKVVWEAIKKNVVAITNYLGPMAIPNVLDIISMYMSNRGESKLNYEFMDYIYNYMKINTELSKKALDTLHKASQRIVDNSLWMDYFYHDLDEWFDEHSKKNGKH